MMDKLLLENSKNYNKGINNTLQGRVVKKDNIRQLIVSGFLSLSLSHYSAIILLLEKGIYSSAFALLRPLIDSVYRGLWVSQIANTDELDKIFNTEEYKFKNTYKLVKTIDKENNTNVFYKRYSQVESFLHGMVHGGIEQLTRQFSKNGDFIEPNFAEDDLLNLINHINAHLAIFLLDYNRYQKDNDLETLGKEILNIKEDFCS